MKFSFKQTLLSVVFLTGAAVLIVEVVATRVLSPYFGNTIYTFSSVIGVILAALSLGYYVGGRFADRRPSIKWFFGIILASGFSVFLLEILVLLLLPSLGYRLSIVSGPLITALILFFLPSVLLGTLSPFAITLLEKHFPKEGIGSLSGSVYFWSTLGSIFGSLFAGFYLIPRFGIHQIIFTIGILLTLLGIGGLYKAQLRKRTLTNLILFAIFVVIVIFSMIISLSKVDAVYVRGGVYEKLIIHDGEFEGRPTRFFLQDRSFSAAMYLDSDELVYDYTKYYVVHRVFSPEVNEALVIGGGAYSIPKALLSNLPQASVDVVEIEPSLHSLAQKYFRLPSDPRLNNFIQDGRRFLNDTEKRYDLIFSDVYYSLYSIPSHFTTLEFFQLALNKLDHEGVFIANFIASLSPQTSSLLFSEIKTFRKVFSNSYFFAVESPDSDGAQNIIFVGFNSERIVNFDDPKIKNDQDPIIGDLADKLIDLRKYDFTNYIVFTDNYAPVEYLTAQLLSSFINQENRE